MKIMIADDEANIRELVKLIIKEAGYQFCECRDGAEAVGIFQKENPDLVILDVMMPKVTGFEVCECIREMRPDVPVLFLSAKGDIVDKKSGYKAGADDYMTKPFHGEELLLHIKALLRRCGKTDKAELRTNDALLVVGDFEFNFRRYEVLYKGVKIDLAPKEFLILALMAEHRGEVFSREDIVKCVWGEDYLQASVNIAVYIRRIREKIEDDPSHPQYLQTVKRFGYRFGD